MLADQALEDEVDQREASCPRCQEASGPRLQPPPAAARRLSRRAHRAMGTEFTVYIDAPDQEQACFQAVFEEIDRVEQTFSRFRDSSELSRINRLAAAGPMVTDPESFHLLAAAQDLSRKTDGAFDITVGRLTRAWGFSSGQPEIPDPQVLSEAEESVGWANLELDPVWRTVQFLCPGLELDLGAIAKGYAVDCALDVLRSAGVHGLIDAGSSSIAATDQDFSRDWTVNVANPADSSVPLCDVPLSGLALSTSGVREQHFERDGRTYSHLIDPTAHGLETAAPLRQALQVTVLAPTSMLADALSTAMFLLGHDRGGIALEQFPNCSALWVYSDPAGIKCQDHNWPVHGFLPWKEGNHG